MANCYSAVIIYFTQSIFLKQDQDSWEGLVGGLLLFHYGLGCFPSPSVFRWWQPGGVDHSFSLDNVYIGPGCPSNCHRRGVCKEGLCHCLDEQEDGAAGEEEIM